jgi:rhodanese-related sulfurtransferase
MTERRGVRSRRPDWAVERPQSRDSLDQTQQARKMRKLSLVVVVLLSIFGLAQPAFAAGEFPHRDQFKEVRVVERETLYRDLDNSIVVDVRSKYEYNTMHIKGAAHIPLTSLKFVDEVKKLRAASTKPIVFYCNGVTCKKSYEAAKKAADAGIANCFAYDAGLYGWAKAHPDRSVLLGKTPMSVEDFIEPKTYKARVLSADAFESRIGPNAIVLDIRDLRQRDNQLFPFREQRAQLDESDKIAAVVQEARSKNKTLLVYDKTGRQSPWFQYYLEQRGVRDYYFLDGGAEGYFEARHGKLKFSVPDA